MATLMRREIPLAITLLVGVIVIADYFVSIPAVNQTTNVLTSWGVVISGFAALLGVINVIKHNVGLIREQKKDYYYSVILLIIFVFMTLIGSIFTIKHPIYDFFYFNVFTPLAVTVWGMLAFWIAGAAYRSFRFTGIDSSIMLTCAILVMLRNAPIGAAIWGGFPPMGDWVMSVLNVATNRGITISIAIGVIAIGIRVLLGAERGYLGSSGGEEA